jgi:hypothetical protein
VIRTTRERLCEYRETPCLRHLAVIQIESVDCHPMKRLALFALLVCTANPSFCAQSENEDSTFDLALPNHPGRLHWHADGFKIMEASAKANGNEIGFRGLEGSGRISFLGFLFLFPEQAPMDSAKCRDGVLAADRRDTPTLQITSTSQIAREGGLPLALAAYTNKGGDGKTLYSVRGFVATGDLCGDLEFYSSSPITSDDADLKAIFATYRLDPQYLAQFKDLLLYAQVLYQHQAYEAAAPLFEKALSKIPDDGSQQTMRRVVTDQAGMSYGISGNVAKARTIFEAAIANDPDYPMYYYNLACADAQEKKLADARTHLQQAFARKANMIPGETIPDPSQDDSFLPYRGDKDFWSFIESLH